MQIKYCETDDQHLWTTNSYGWAATSAWKILIFDKQWQLPTPTVLLVAVNFVRHTQQSNTAIMQSDTHLTVKNLWVTVGIRPQSGEQYPRIRMMKCLTNTTSTISSRYLFSGRHVTRKCEFAGKPPTDDVKIKDNRDGQVTMKTSNCSGPWTHEAAPRFCSGSITYTNHLTTHACICARSFFVLFLDFLFRDVLVIPFYHMPSIRMDLVVDGQHTTTDTY